MSPLWIVASIGPPLLLIGYGLFKARDSWSSPTVWCALAAGIGVSGFAIPVEGFVQSLIGPEVPLPTTDPLQAGLHGFLIAALPEEALKMAGILFAMLLLDARRLRSMITVSVAVAMGFAGIENILYMMKAGSEWQAVALLRGGASVPIHGVCGLMMGALMVGTIANDVTRWVGLLLALMVPVALHGTFDTLLMYAGPQFEVVKMPAVVVAMLGGGVLAVALCNAAVLAALHEDGEKDIGGPIGGPLRSVLKRAARLYLIVVFVPVALGGFQADALWHASLLAVLPAVLTFDVLFSRPQLPLRKEREWVRVEAAQN